MEVQAKNISRGDEINIIGDNVEIIADIILRELCSLDEVTDGAATYKTEYVSSFNGGKCTIKKDNVINHIIKLELGPKAKIITGE